MNPIPADLDPVAAPWPEEATSRMVPLGGPVRVLDLGGPPGAPVVLCVHGLGGSALNWGLLGPRLTASSRVLAVDLFGHGSSGLPEGPRGLAADRVLLQRLVDEVVGEPVLLVGHSMGGVLAALHAAAAPASLRGLVLLAPPVPGSTGRVDAAIAAKRLLLRTPGVAALVRRTVRKLSPEEVVDRQLRDATPHRERIAVEAITASVAETRERQLRPDADAAQAQQWAGIVDTMAHLSRPRAWRQVLTAIDVPALWLQGADDPLADMAAARLTAACRPDWPFEVRRGVGHLLALEDPAWVAERIQSWLEAA